MNVLVLFVKDVICVLQLAFFQYSSWLGYFPSIWVLHAPAMVAAHAMVAGISAFHID